MKLIYNSISVFLLAAFMSSLPAFSQKIEQYEVDLESQSENRFSAKYFKYIRSAYSDFSKKQKKLDCFEIYVDEVDENIEVSFLNIVVKKIDEETIIVDNNSTERCGQGVTYIYSKDMKKLKKVFQR
jgi:deoxyadenosine/deoxycytidine kinase